MMEEIIKPSAPSTDPLHCAVPYDAAAFSLSSGGPNEGEAREKGLGGTSGGVPGLIGVFPGMGTHLLRCVESLSCVHMQLWGKHNGNNGGQWMASV